MSDEKLNPIDLHKRGNTLYETEKYSEAAEIFLQSSMLYEKKGNFFDASNMIFKAGECSFMLGKFKTAIERFMKSAEISFVKGFDRFGVSALEYVRDCYKALKKEKSKEAVEIRKRIGEVKEKLAAQPF